MLPFGKSVPGELLLTRSSLALGLRFAVLLALVSGLSSCIATEIVVSGYYKTSGGCDYDAHVTAAWRGPDGELAIALEDLEGVCRRQSHVLVLTAAELEQAFAGTPSKLPLLPVPHVRLPRAILMREVSLARPAPGSEAFVPAEAWDAGTVDVQSGKHYVLPGSNAGKPFAVHWTHYYRTGATDETGFALLVTRSSEKGVERALFLPAAFETPTWINALVPLALATDALWIALLIF